MAHLDSGAGKAHWAVAERIGLLTTPVRLLPNRLIL